MCCSRDYKASHDNTFMPFFLVVKEEKNKAVTLVCLFFFGQIVLLAVANQCGNDVTFEVRCS